MSDFNLAELMPFYLDETDEHIAALNDALLRLENSPADAQALQEAFRMFHSIKGASVVMGFQPVSRLTHHLESLFDQLRGKKRVLDRPVLDVTFRCLDELRDYHRDLRANGGSDVDLSGALDRVVAYLQETTPTSASGPRTPAKKAPPVVVEFVEPGCFAVVVIFEPKLPLVDMKARLVVNRLSTKARILASDPPIERLDELDSLERFVVHVMAECHPNELIDLADVEGAVRVYIETEATTEANEESVLLVPVDILTTSDSTSVPTPASTPAPVPVEPPAIAVAAAKSRVVETIRVDSDRLDHLMNLAGELVITKARFTAISRGFEELFRGSNARALRNEASERLESLGRALEGMRDLKSGAGVSVERFAADFRRLREQFRGIERELERVGEAREHLKSLSETVHGLGRVSDGLQKGVLDTRMVPIGPLFERFRRVIRDLAMASGKEVTLRIGGEKTELDKRMIDELSDPLIHMVRNSVDHGLEQPDQRERAGKSRMGTVSLLATHRGNSVVITVGDDGQGIDVGRIREKIVAKGLVTAAEARELSDRELVAYIWHPGLSTAETITEVSGRGVGMDIVKSRIENLNGVVDVRSILGQGTTFTIRLPLTLAIMPCLLVHILGEVYAIPLDHIDEIVEVGDDRILRVQGQPALELREKIIAVVSLADVFDWGRTNHPGAGDGLVGHFSRERRIVVVVQNGETTIGIQVDGLIGMQEVVLKSIEKNYRAIPGLSGAGILGDGRVSLILDLDAVIELASRRSRRNHSKAAVAAVE